MDTRQAERFDHHGGEYPDGLYRADVRAQSLGDLDDVDDSAIEQYRALGFLAVDRALDETEVADALAGLLKIIDDRPDGIDLQFETAVADDLDEMAAVDRQDSVRKLMSFTTADARLRAVAEHPAVLAAVRAILDDDDVILLQDMALLKPPGGGREKPWHQDKAFFDVDLSAPIVGVWIALDAATHENGCMHVIPGSHNAGPVPHFARRDWQICDTDVATARDVAVPLPSGGLLFFDGYLHHGTPANRTRTRRRALQFHYVARSARPITEVERLDVFGGEGRGAEC